MKYRITEFKVEQPETGFKFFTETGSVYKEKLFLFIYVNKINWNIDAGFKTFDEAISRINEIKLAQPIYHEIK